MERPELKMLKSEFLKSTWRFEGGIGGNLQLIPSRLNTIESSSNSIQKESYSNSLGIAPGILLGLNIQPISNKFVAYEYGVKYSEAWLFPMSASSNWSAHHISLGYDYLFFTMNYEKNKTRYSYFDVNEGISTDKTEEISNSVYESMSTSYGIQYLMNKEKGRSIELRKIKRSFSNFTSPDAGGYGLYYRSNNHCIQLEYIRDHAINASSVVSPDVLKKTQLENTAMYIHFSFVKYFGVESDYPSTRKKLFYF